MELDLKKAKDWNEISHIVGESVRKARPGQWIEVVSTESKLA